MIKSARSALGAAALDSPDYNPTRDSHTPLDNCSTCGLLVTIAQTQRQLVSLIHRFVRGTTALTDLEGAPHRTA